MAFRFSLEQILKYRSGLEEQAQEELARRKLLVEQAARKLDDLHEEEKNMHIYWRGQTKKEIDLVFLNQTCDYLMHIGHKIDVQSEEKKKALVMVDEQRAALKKRWQDRRVMELLKDNFYTDYLETEGKRERSFNDELSLTSFVRRRRSGNALL